MRKYDIEVPNININEIDMISRVRLSPIGKIIPALTTYIDLATA